VDNSRRVRQLAHSLQGQIVICSGKRIAKYLPTTVGAWLAGMHDNDKLVMRTAKDAFGKSFASDEKQRNVWRVYQGPILEYCSEIIFQENVRTICDERTTSPDDAEAKYARVIGSTISTVVDAIGIFPCFVVS
jgi:E3 ubiquitin-protein ligase listerin